ncbi:MAG: hypothetical protein ACK4Q5_13855 [Saprospiraceae bacterium]
MLFLDCNPSASGCSPSVCVRWFRPGCHRVLVRYQCIGYTELRDRTVYVSMVGTNTAEFAVSNVANCAPPDYSFTLTRTITDPVKRHRILAYALDSNGNPTNPPIWETGWLNGNFTSRTLTSADNIPFVSGTNYRFRLQTEDACGTDDFFLPNSYLIKGYAKPLARYKINGSDDFPVNVFSCDNSPIIMQDATIFQGCDPNTDVAEIRMSRANSACTAALAGTTQTVTVPYASSYNLRALFPAYTSTPGPYRVAYRVQGNLGWSALYTRCVNVNALSPSNAEFLLNGPNNSPELPRTDNPNAGNTAIGQFSCGLVTTNVTSEIGSLTAYRVQIWRTVGTLNAEDIFDSGSIPITPQSPFPENYDFNPPTGLYFFNLNATQVNDYRLKVRFTVTNICGDVFKESFFKILPGCPGCLTNDDGQAGSRSAGASEAAQVSVAPNPFRDAITVRYRSAALGEARFDLFDPTGRNVLSTVLAGPDASADEQVLPVAELPAGIYHWRIAGKSSAQTGSVAKNYPILLFADPVPYGLRTGSAFIQSRRL